ncbi:MAG: response regulator [Muribaculaceae bacterium]|nr:response regulator [Muribaculaceae bacterium]MDE7386582.1 response regulator [Muribaculaceae bacterium]
MMNYNTAHQGHILVASNDHEDCALIRSQFEPYGFLIECCKSMRDVYMTDLSPYCIILLELSENIEEGLHAIESIKQRSSTRETPVLVYSTSKRSDVLVDALNAGADDYVLKPFSVRELSARVNAVLRSTRG